MALAIVCWFILSSGMQVCSAPLPYDEAMMVFHLGPSEGTSMPSIYKDGTPEFRAKMEEND